MERVQAAHYDNSHDSAALLRLLINDCINGIKGQVPHTTHNYTKHTKRKTTERKKVTRHQYEISALVSQTPEFSPDSDSQAFFLFRSTQNLKRR